jgi:hypothetical protein
LSVPHSFLSSSEFGTFQLSACTFCRPLQPGRPTTARWDSLFAPAGGLLLDRVRQPTIIHKGGAIWSSELGDGCKVVVRGGRLFRSDHSGCSPKRPLRGWLTAKREPVLKLGIAGGGERGKGEKGHSAAARESPQPLWLADSHEATRVNVKFSLAPPRPPVYSSGKLIRTSTSTCNPYPGNDIAKRKTRQTGSKEPGRPCEIHITLHEELFAGGTQFSIAFRVRGNGAYSQPSRCLREVDRLCLPVCWDTRIGSSINSPRTFYST